MQSLKYVVVNYMLIFKIQQNFWSMRPFKKQKVGEGVPFINTNIKFMKKFQCLLKYLFTECLFWWLNIRNLISNGYELVGHINELRCFIMTVSHSSFEDH